ncbi:MAG: ABC transporter permease subunit [Cellulosilyticaceae bacterium]
MANYEEVLYDHIGNKYERKNEYIKELVKLQDAIDRERDKGKRQQLLEKKKQYIRAKEAHPYSQQLKAFKEKEKAFKAQLKVEKKQYKETLKAHQSNQLKKLYVDLFVAEKEKAFYEDYCELCYDAELAYKNGELVTAQLGEIIAHLQDNLEGRVKAKEAQGKVGAEENQQAKTAVAAFCKEQEAQHKEQVKALKQKQKEGIISEKAYQNEKKLLQREMRTKIDLQKDTIPTRALKQEIRSKNYEIRKGSKQKCDVLKDNLAHIRRTTPIEAEGSGSLLAYLTCLLPGVGQLVHKQYIKSILFMIGTLFIYGIAIPYALGYGNYQGKGIGGLISLAQGGPKISKSLIYMIEGIVALFLIIVAATILILSFIDVYKVQKNAFKGIRPKNWFESKRSILAEGFPYLVSLPTITVILFIVIVPITTAILLSFTNMDPKHQSKFTWIGLSNYMAIIKGEGMAGSIFWRIFGWTIIWTIVGTSLGILIGFFLALLVNNERVKGKNFVRIVYILPWAVPFFITVMFFSIMVSRQGVLTELIYNLTGASLDIKNDTTLTRIAIICIQGWLGSAYIFLLSTGVLQAIPSDLYEAAQIDGATSWQKLRRITLPMVLFQTAPLLVGQYTFNFNNFSLVYLFNSGGPFNPKVYGNLAGSSDILISYIFKLTMENQQQAIGAAITIVISLGLMVFAFLGFKNSKAFKEEKL